MVVGVSGIHLHYPPSKYAQESSNESIPALRRPEHNVFKDIMFWPSDDTPLVLSGGT